jgi:hypothetical protein
MANKKEEAIAAQSPAALARPDFIEKGSAGTTHITKDDMRIPRCAIAQALNPQLDEDKEDSFIDGLKQGDMFNSLTGTIYGRGPLEFFVLRADPPRFVEFIPREEGGGVKDMNVKPSDPRTQFTTDDKGDRVKPIATKFYDYFIVLADGLRGGKPFLDTVVALSFKSSQLKKAQDLNTLIRGRETDIYAGKYSITSVVEPSAKGKFFGWKVSNAGWADSPEMLAVLKKMSSDLAGKNIEVDHAGEQREEDDSFEPNSM